MSRFGIKTIIIPAILATFSSKVREDILYTSTQVQLLNKALIILGIMITGPKIL